MLIWILTFVSVLVIYLLKKDDFKIVKIARKTLKRDINAGIRFSKVNYTLFKWEKNRETIAKLFTKLVEKHPDKVAIYFEGEKWTYQQLEDFSNQVANYFKTNYSRGDVVALVLENRPEYVGIWLGLSKIGVITALINTNLTADPLIHSIQASKAKGLIFGSNQENTIKNIFPNLETIKLYQFHEDSTKVDVLNEVTNLKQELSYASKISPSDEIKKGNTRDRLIFIYTSGTTGLPKAAVISNLRYMLLSCGCHFMMNLNENDIIYNSLPLYHSAGGMFGLGQALLFSTSVALRKKFSASNFWLDCKKYNCTVAQYIGEICRYLLAVHKEGAVVDHPVIKMAGNGLRPQIWNQFVDTFKIKNVFEFYGATEGNTNLMNIDSTPGAVGFVPRYARLVYPVTLLRCNEATGEPIRNEQGFCSRCDIGEPGVLVGKINHKRGVNDFSGYADKKATEKKIVINVFKTGDMYFNSGDVLVQDEYGYYYFKDRTGDTFRWKGENVATSEVEAVISNVIDLKDSIVYGVEIPGTEGKAGMMAIVDPNDNLDKEQLCKGLKKNLPTYAVPIFLRIMESVPITGTFKLKKTDLQAEAFNINKTNDKIYFLDAKNATYIPLSPEIHDSIVNGKVKL